LRRLENWRSGKRARALAKSIVQLATHGGQALVTPRLAVLFAMCSRTRSQTSRLRRTAAATRHSSCCRERLAGVLAAALAQARLPWHGGAWA